MSLKNLGAPAKGAFARACATLAFAALAVAVAFAPAGAADEKKGTGMTTDAKGGKDVAVIKTSMGTIVFELYPEIAPKMVENFKDLANTKFYNGTTFHRVINTFMIQGGDPLSKDDDPTNDGTGSGPRKMPAEFTNKKSHVRGIVSTARANDPNSGSCQFFIVVKDSAFLDGKYTIFGNVIEGMDVADKIANVPKDANDRPLKNVVMESVTIEKR
ncbi:MAG TPA: peptidylprolyl isomerase [Candidatus Polarisedimenticolia bacterium]|nr:peptidylprolyl isomerase [Candidatus Polarisedimenticolia bacterium]